MRRVRDGDARRVGGLKKLQNFFAGGAKLIGCQLQLGAGEVEVIGAIDGDKMEVGMRHFQADDGEAATIAVECFFNGLCYRLCEEQQLRKIIVGNVKKFIDFQLWHDQGMSFTKRKYV